MSLRCLAFAIPLGLLMWGVLIMTVKMIIILLTLCVNGERHYCSVGLDAAFNHPETSKVSHNVASIGVALLTIEHDQ